MSLHQVGRESCMAMLVAVQTHSRRNQGGTADTPDNFVGRAPVERAVRVIKCIGFVKMLTAYLNVIRLFAR
jgi:hypothetical protein